MSARSGVFTKYVVQFVGAKLTVSNDRSVGDLAIDADVTVTMSRGTLGTTFKITLYGLPLDKAKLLSDAAPALRTVTIQLGYFDSEVQPVMEGVYDKVESKAGTDKTLGQDKLVTTISGKEAALVACSETKYTASLSDKDASSYTSAAQSVLSTVFSDANKEAHPGFDSLLKRNPIFDAPLKKEKSDTKFNNDTVLTVLGEIAKKADAELLVVDKTVFLGSPIKREAAASQPKLTLDPSTNLAKIEKVKLALKPKTPGADKSKPPKEVPVQVFSFTALGDPTMRPGQTIVVSEIKEFASPPEYRIRTVEHQFNASTGYVCVGGAAEVLKDGARALDIDSAIKQNAATGAQDVASAIKSEAAKNPVVEVTSVKAATEAYQADLYHGQPRDDEQQPSIEVAIEPQDDHVYKHRPIASPFAWRKCGLVTPVYPGMKALVAHNLALATDGIVTGYIWSKQPDFAPPSNQTGDWWLCLPIDFDATQPPTDQTKAVNDLTANNGCRVIELKGLRITVGADTLKEIGKRPTPGDAEVCTIAHASGTVVTVKKGEIDVDTGVGPKLTMTSSGITLTDGTLNVKLANGKLAIG